MYIAFNMLNDGYLMILIIQLYVCTKWLGIAAPASPSDSCVLNSSFFIITLVFEKNANFCAENCQKFQKIVIIASTPGSESSRKCKYKMQT
jgi:hypothetical protein